jgi:hypothetical protein
MSHEDVLAAEFDTSPSTSSDLATEPSPEPRTPKEEEIQPLEFSSRFEDDPSRNIRNTSNHHNHEKLMASFCLYETLN